MKNKVVSLFGILVAVAIITINLNVVFTQHTSNFSLIRFNNIGSTIYANGETPVEGYQQAYTICELTNSQGQIVDGCKRTCPDGPNPTCTLSICQYWYNCMD
jgi:hypothetical protein